MLAQRAPANNVLARITVEGGRFWWPVLVSYLFWRGEGARKGVPYAGMSVNLEISTKIPSRQYPSIGDTADILGYTVRRHPPGTRTMADVLVSERPGY